MARKLKGMESQLFEEQKKRFQQIYEYTIAPYTMTEDGEDEQQPEGNEEPPQGAEDGMPQMDAQMPPQGGGMPQDQSMMQSTDMGQGGGMPQQDDPSLTQGFNPQGAEGDIPQMDTQMPPVDGQMPEGGEQPTENDDVVDITALTDSQEATERDVAQLDNKFGKLMKKLEDFEGILKKNDDRINDLKAEFEKRNPTQIEKMSMNTAHGEPFNLSPEKYWDEKEATSNYSRENDNNGKGQGPYVITADDVNGNVDWSTIAKTLGDDFIMHQTLDKAFKF